MQFDLEALTKTVAEKANISLEQARKVVPVVIEQLKTKLPAPIAKEFEGLVAGTPLAGIKL